MKTILLYSLLLSFFFSGYPSIYGQVKWNFGLTNGTSISGFKKDLHEDISSGGEIITGFSNQDYKPVFDFSGGIFGEISFKNFSFKTGINHLSTGESYEAQVKIETVNSGDFNHFSNQDIRLEYLQIPLELEVQFEFFKLHPFISFGIAPAFYLNDYLRTTSTDGLSEVFVSEGSFEEISTNNVFFFGITDEFVHKMDYAFLLGGGFYLNPRISLGVWYGKGKKKVFCPSGPIHSESCVPFLNTKTVMIQLQMRLFKKNLNDVIRFDKKKKAAKN